MHNRISKYSKELKQDISTIKQFFLACECKPNTTLWNILEPFAFDVKPAYTFGTLGIMGYMPEAYSIISLGSSHEKPPLVGYLLTITNPDTCYLLDKLKGFNGPDSFNVHMRRLIHVYTTPKKVTSAWCYQLSSRVVSSFEQIGLIDFGLWDENDERQFELVDRIEKHLE